MTSHRSIIPEHWPSRGDVRTSWACHWWLAARQRFEAWAIWGALRPVDTDHGPEPHGFTDVDASIIPATASFVVQAVLLVEVGGLLHVLDRAVELSVIDESTSVGRQTIDRPHRSGSHMCERIIDLPQWNIASCTCSTAVAPGGRGD